MVKFNLRKLCYNILVMVCCATVFAQDEIKIGNGDFESGVNSNGFPLIWKPYGKQLPPPAENYCYAVVKADGNANKALFILDNDALAETGVMTTIPAKEKCDYVLSLDARAATPEDGNGCNMQLRFLPSQKYVHEAIKPGIGEYETSELCATAPEGTTAITIFLYSHRAPKPKVIIDNVKLGYGKVAVKEVKPLKRNLYLETDIVKDGKRALSVIVPSSGEFDVQAGEIAAAVKSKTGVELKIIKDDGDAELTKLTENFIILGNRNNNRYISSLYDRYYCILDRCYPGEGGSIVRSLHNPFGDGHNIIFAGGSDREGTVQAVKTLIGKINELQYADSRLQIGRLAEIKMGKGLKVPENAENATLLEASRGYGNAGYFGWNSLSKNMALYYMTGDEKFAREFLRLAFPDAKALKYINEVDKEMIEVKNDPLGGPYHYGAMLMVIYWDLIEESPVFSDVDREKVIAGFFRQLNYWKGGNYQIFKSNKPAPNIGSRHAQWEALCIFALCRYLDRYYSNADTVKGLKSVENFFAPLENNGGVYGEWGSLFWYNTSIEPVFTYVLLSGSRSPEISRKLQELAAGQTILLNGRDNDWAIGFAAIELMLKMAYLLDDQRFFLLAEKVGFKQNQFWLGQSFCPDKPYRRDSMAEQVGKWNFNHPPRDVENQKFDLDKLFMFGSYRNETGENGDFMLWDGSYEGGRNIYHCLALLSLRIGGIQLLTGHHNQVYLYKDGMYGTKFPKLTEIIKTESIGQLTCFQGRIADYNGHALDRMLLLQKNRYAVFADTVTALDPGKITTIEILWDFSKTSGSPVLKSDGDIAVNPTPYSLSAGGILTPELVKFAYDGSYQASGNCAKLSYTKNFAKGESKTFFTVLAPAGIAGPASAPYRSGLVAKLPETAIIQKTGQSGTVSIVTKVYLSAINFVDIDGLGHAESPVDLYWDFAAGQLTINSDCAATAEFSVEQPDNAVSADIKNIERSGNTIKLKLNKGTSTLTGTYPTAGFLSGVKTELAQAEKNLTAADRAKVSEKIEVQNTAPTMTSVWKLPGNGNKVAAFAPFPFKDGGIAAIAGKTLLLIEPGGKKQEIILNDLIGVLHWWPEKKMLVTGSKDDKVTAWGVDKQKKWEFVSVMAPEVEKTGKFYWYKDPKYYPGVWGLSSGKFLNGEEQLFVGSACTLEILDGSGKLIKRLAEFWGPLGLFAMVPQVDGSTSLASGMTFCGFPEFGIVNNRKPDEVAYRFRALPPEIDGVGGFSVLNNTGIFCEDINGDGKKEVIVSQNGSWNRILIYDADGKFLYQASLGPGEKPVIPTYLSKGALNINDIALADFNGDGKKQIVVALSRRVVLCFDNQCQNIWSLPLDSEPVLIITFNAESKKQDSLVIACRNGSILKVNSNGKIIGQTKVDSCPSSLMTNDNKILVGTEKGEICAFQL